MSDVAENPFIADKNDIIDPAPIDMQINVDDEFLGIILFVIREYISLQKPAHIDDNITIVIVSDDDIFSPYTKIQ